MSAFKEYFDQKMVERLADDLVQVYPRLKHSAFIRDAVDGLEALELKARSRQIAAALHSYLPPDYPEAIEIIIRALGAPLVSDRDCLNDGFYYWPFADFVAEYGVDYFEQSMRANYEITQRFTAEFSIRPFLERYPVETRKLLKQWAHDANPHVRRLVSEGTRPRLPWASLLSDGIKDPGPNLPLLEALKDDSSRYVTRSVANHLNDIGKDHPELLMEICETWMADASEETRWLIRHALRNHIKQGNQRALTLLGYGKTELQIDLKVQPINVKMGGEVFFDACLINLSGKPQRLMLDYRLHLLRKNGSRSIKVFKWKDLCLAPGQRLTLKKKHSFRPVSTRVYYPGSHRVDLQANGEVLACADFCLK